MGTPLGLVSFNDEAQWAVPAGSDGAAVAAGLSELRPAGNYTVLHDALFVAARDLEQGGVVLVVTDGRDENSATTVDDVARLCETQHVRIVTASVGRHVDERALRRLALISEGEYVGALLSLESAVIVQAVTRARQGVSSEVTAAVTEPAQPAVPVEAKAEPAAAEEAAPSLPPWLVPAGLATLLVIVVV